MNVLYLLTSITGEGKNSTESSEGRVGTAGTHQKKTDRKKCSCTVYMGIDIILNHIGMKIKISDRRDREGERMRKIKIARER